MIPETHSLKILCDWNSGPGRKNAMSVKRSAPSEGHFNIYATLLINRINPICKNMPQFVLVWSWQMRMGGAIDFSDQPFNVTLVHTVLFRNNCPHFAISAQKLPHLFLNYLPHFVIALAPLCNSMKPPYFVMLSYFLIQLFHFEIPPPVCNEDCPIM